MPLNPQKGKMYKWVTHTWNPLGGECPHQCQYCYVPAMARTAEVKEKYSNKPRLIEKEIRETRMGGKLKTIFVCNMSDLFAVGVENEEIQAIIDHCTRWPENTFLFQTKNPERLLDFEFPFPVIFCTTIESNRDYPGMSKAPIVAARQKAMIEVKKRFPKATIATTIEPILDFDLSRLLAIIRGIKPKMVSVGADTKRHGLPEPTREKTEALIAGLEEFTKVDRKELSRLV